MLVSRGRSRWRGSCLLAEGGQELGEVLAHGRRIRVIRPEAPFKYRQGATKERLCLAEAVRRLEQAREIVEADRNPR
jgi:hypothetical protein